MSSLDGRYLAIIRRPGFGLRDNNSPCLWFDAEIPEGVGALQVIFDSDHIRTIFQAAQAYDVRDLEGKPCWVNRENGLLKFERIAKVS